MPIQQSQDHAFPASHRASHLFRPEQLPAGNRMKFRIVGAAASLANLPAPNIPVFLPEQREPAALPCKSLVPRSWFLGAVEQVR